MAPWDEPVGIKANMPAFKDARFDLNKPNELHRFGWVVEHNPMDPTNSTIRRSALGRAGHEGVWAAYPTGGRPRSSTVAIRKKDGGVIGT